MDKDLERHIEFDIQQLQLLWDKLALYPKVQEEVRDLIKSLEKNIKIYATHRPKSKSK